MNWQKIETAQTLADIDQLSQTQKVLVFKHSTHCSISATALNRLERAWQETEMQNLKTFYLDLIAFRDISNQIAQKYQVQHESPQVLVIENGQCIYHNAHYGISYPELKQFTAVK